MASERQQIFVITEQLERFSGTVIKKITLDVTGNLVDTTPVDTGWARANWVPSIGTPDTRVLSSDAKNQNVAAALNHQASGYASIAKYQLGPTVHVSNNVPYINRLNEGTSKQAPAGFVQQAIRKALTRDILSIRSVR